MKSIPVVGVVLLVLGRMASAVPLDRTEEVRAAIRGGCARNVILLIGDGMGDSEITAARNYAVGAGGRLTLDTLPLTGTYTTYSVAEEQPELPDYVVDSAASATAWATGHKTSNRRLSTSPGADEPMPTIVEIAKQHGLRTGSVTTDSLTGATPAALASHINDRSCEGPADMARCPQYAKAAGGAGSIAEQSVDRRIDVLLGGGLARFEQLVVGGEYTGQSVVDVARAKGYAVVTTADGLAAATAVTPLLGLFAPAAFALEWEGEAAKAYPGSGPQRCVGNPQPPDQPSLAAMARKAIDILSSDDKGFFLQIEGALIDKEDHASNPCGQIGETVAFDAAVKVALDFARERGDTLVIVTGDHAHASQIVSVVMTEKDHSAGGVSTLTTNEGAQMAMSYAANLPGRWQGHTGTQIRIAAYGPQAANVVGVTDQTELFYTMARALELIEGAHCGLWNRVGRFFGVQ